MNECPTTQPISEAVKMTSPGPRIPKRYLMLRLRPTAWPAADRTTPFGDPVVPESLGSASVTAREMKR